jgi:hypothetical protein
VENAPQKALRVSHPSHRAWKAPPVPPDHIRPSPTHPRTFPHLPQARRRRTLTVGLRIRGEKKSRLSQPAGLSDLAFEVRFKSGRGERSAGAVSPQFPRFSSTIGPPTCGAHGPPREVPTVNPAFDERTLTAGLNFNTLSKALFISCSSGGCQGPSPKCRRQLSAGARRAGGSEARRSSGTEVTHARAARRVGRIVPPEKEAASCPPSRSPGTRTAGRPAGRAAG